MGMRVGQCPEHCYGIEVLCVRKKRNLQRALSPGEDPGPSFIPGRHLGSWVPNPLTPFLTSCGSASSKDLRTSALFHRAPQHPPPGCSLASTTLCLLLNTDCQFSRLLVLSRLRRRGLGVSERRRCVVFPWSSRPMRELRGPTAALSDRRRLPPADVDTEIAGPHAGRRVPRPLGPRPVPSAQLAGLA